MPLVSLKGAAAKFNKSDLWRYGLEFVIVFLSVYLAFVLTDYQEELRKQEIQVKYYDNLLIEIEFMVHHLDEEEEKLAYHVAILDEIGRGGRPIIPASELYYLFEGGVAQAALDGGNFEWLDLGLLENITQTRPLLEALSQRVVLFNRLTADLAPLQLSGANCCYDSEGQLFPHMSWYPRLIGEMHSLNRGIHEYLVQGALPEIQRLLNEYG